MPSSLDRSPRDLYPQQSQLRISQSGRDIQDLTNIYPTQLPKTSHLRTFHLKTLHLRTFRLKISPPHPTDIPPTKNRPLVLVTRQRTNLIKKLPWITLNPEMWFVLELSDTLLTLAAVLHIIIFINIRYRK